MIWHNMIAVTYSEIEYVVVFTLAYFEQAAPNFSHKIDEKARSHVGSLLLTASQSISPLHSYTPDLPHCAHHPPSSFVTDARRLWFP